MVPLLKATHIFYKYNEKKKKKNSFEYATLNDGRAQIQLFPSGALSTWGPCPSSLLQLLAKSI